MPRPAHRARRPILVSALVLGLFILAPRSAQASQPSPRDVAAAVVAAARALIGAPYAYIGDDPSTGFSCIGFVHYLYGRFGVDVPYELNLAYASAPHVARSDLQPGDLVFFSNTVWKGLSHVALYAGDDYIIGADNFMTGVEETHLSNPYWVAHYTGATRPLHDGATLAMAAAHLPLRPVLPMAALTVRVGQLLRGRTAGDVYTGPGYGYPRIDRLASRVTVRVVRVQGQWANVVYAGAGSAYYGWVDAPYIAACTVLAASAPRRGRATPPSSA